MIDLFMPCFEEFDSQELRLIQESQGCYITRDQHANLLVWEPDSLFLASHGGSLYCVKLTADGNVQQSFTGRDEDLIAVAPLQRLRILALNNTLKSRFNITESVGVA